VRPKVVPKNESLHKLNLILHSPMNFGHM